MTFEKIYENEKIILSDDTLYVKGLLKDKKPAVLLLNENNKGEDTFFAKYAIELPTGLTDTEPAKVFCGEILNDDYCKKIISRIKGLPLTIAVTKRLVIRELTQDDSEDVVSLYNDGSAKFLKSFFDSPLEAKELIKKYTENVYDFSGYGYWGIFDKYSGKFLGLTGFTGKGEDILELGYGVTVPARNKGIAFEACVAAIDYAIIYLDFSLIEIVTDKENTAAGKLAEKLISFYKENNKSININHFYNGGTLK